MILLFQVAKNGVIQDDQFLIDIHRFVFDAKVKIPGLTFVKKWRLGYGLVPIYCCTTTMVDLGNLSKKIPMVGQEVHQPYSGAQKITISCRIIGGQIIQVIKGFFVILPENFFLITSHGPEKPKAQFGQEGLQPLGDKRVIVILCVDDAFRI